MSSDSPLKVVIIGGVAGGASAAARLRRLSEEAEIIILEKSGYISFANCGLPYYLGGVIAERDKLLLQTPESMGKRFRIDVRVNSEAVEIRPREKVVVVEHSGPDGRGRYELSYDKLVLAPGAKPVRPKLPGLDLPHVFTLRNMEDCDHVKNFMDDRLAGPEPKKALVVGGGFIGLEMMENLTRAGLAVTGVELTAQVLAPLDPEMAAHLKAHLREKGVDLCLSVGLAEIAPGPEGHLSCRLKDGRVLVADMVILGLGVSPDTGLARAAGLTLTEGGAIEVDGYMRTSEPDIYAVGDAVSVRDFVAGLPQVMPLAGPANRQGRLAAGNIIAETRPGRELKAYSGTQGTLICRVFELTAGATGLNEKRLRQLGWRYDKVYLHPASHASYYPGPEPISLKVLFDPDNGRLLGAQAVGRLGVDKRLDVLAAALRAGLTVRDLADLELAYAPPYSSAKDPVNMAGFLASNVLDGQLRQVFSDDLAAHLAGPEPAPWLLDVRTPKEYQGGSLPGAANIPVDELRERLDELPRDRPIVTFCQVGLRSYLAYRILSQSGFDRLANLSGGYRGWLAQMEADRPSSALYACLGQPK